MASEKAAQMRQMHPLISNTELAYNLIYDEIIAGTLKMGQKLHQEKLSEAYAMSRSPIRDALLRLEKEGFVVNEGGGFRVCTVDVMDYIEYSEFRINIESFSAYYAARNASREQLCQMEQYVQQCEERAAEKDLRGFCKADEKFHDLIAEASCNQYVQLWFEKNRQKITFYRYLFTAPNNFDYPVKQHRRILAALKQHEEELASRAMKKHLDNYIKYLRSKLTYG